MPAGRSLLPPEVRVAATWAKGVERFGERSVTVTGDNLLTIYESFVAVTYITRQAGGR